MFRSLMTIIRELYLCLTKVRKGNGKVIPLQALCGPEGG